MTELLAPAGDLIKLKVALMYGADACFIGGKRFSLRAKASNFEIEDILEACNFAHKLNKKVYVTCNIFPHNDDLDGLDDYLIALDKCGVDAIITSSFYIMEHAKKLNLSFEIHVSTQRSISNINEVKFFEEYNVDRVVLARELSLKDIDYIKSNSSMPLEVFIHGGMCSAISGRCTLSNNMTDRDANRGGCAHSCRWYYDLYDGTKKISSDELEFRIGSKDLCSFEVLPELLKMNIDSLKIEGRMKSLHYIANIVSIYRKAIDDYQNGCYNKDLYYELLRRAESRETCSGFFLHDISNKDGIYGRDKEIPSQDFIGMVIDDSGSMPLIEERNYFDQGDRVIIKRPLKDDEITTIKHIYDIDGNEIISAHKAMEKLYIDIGKRLEKFSIITKKRA